MKAVLMIDMDNAAFEDAPASELGRILRDLVDRIESGQTPPITLRDYNGNAVGGFDITKRGPI